MPTYGYRCSSCGHEFEVLQKMSDAALEKCPKCSGKLQKKVYATGVIFKGSGFYKTDYSNSGSSGASSSNGSSESGKGEKSSSEKAGESKPAAEPKSESKAPSSDSSE